MLFAKQIKGFAGTPASPRVIFTANDTYLTLYAQQGATTVNITYAEVAEGANIENIRSIDCISSVKPLNTFEEFQSFIETYEK